ncbi:MAG: hypothetical protein ACRDYX_19015 [Egibacteraceae bacterium]
MVEGTTENAAVCTRLAADLAERGLDASAGVLFVADGGKAIDKAVRAVFGDKATQRLSLNVRCSCTEDTAEIPHQAGHPPFSGRSSY